MGNWPLGRSSSDHEYDWTVKFLIIRSNYIYVTAAVSETEYSGE